MVIHLDWQTGVTAMGFAEQIGKIHGAYTFGVTFMATMVRHPFWRQNYKKR